VYKMSPESPVFLEDITENVLVSFFYGIFISRTDKLQSFKILFTALHGMQTRSGDENSVRPSVCPSVRPSNA